MGDWFATSIQGWLRCHPSSRRVIKLTNLNWSTLSPTRRQETTRICSYLNVSIQRPNIYRHSWNTANEQKPRTPSTGRSFLPQTRTMTPRGRKSASSPKTSMVRNSRSSIPNCIALFVVKIPVTPPGCATSSRQKARKSLSAPRRIKIGSPGK